MVDLATAFFHNVGDKSLETILILQPPSKPRKMIFDAVCLLYASPTESDKVLKTMLTVPSSMKGGALRLVTL